MYLCGATVQGDPHIGHVRSGVAFDVLRRWLLAHGNDVAFVRNVTDIDDKILNKAAGAGRPWWEWAATFERSFTWAYDQLGVLPPSIEPRATGHVTQMVEMMERLIENGHAYAAGGDVYFDVQSYPEYGALSGHKLDDVHQGESAAEGKRDPRDFTLWKAVKPGEPSWPTPWGPGRPGWHLECSAMAEFYLGAAFDIHCGGRDLVFPHHENEIAQAKCAGDDFAQYWLHNGWVTMSGEKMSKSLGNVLSVPNVLKKVRPQELRYYLGSAHYRSNLEYSDEALDESAKSYQGLESFVLRTHKRAGGVELGTWTEGFAAALDNDLSVPIALAEIHARRARVIPRSLPVISTRLGWLPARCGPCSRSWASTHSTSIGRSPVATPRRQWKLWTCWCGPISIVGSRHVRKRTGRWRTRSAIASSRRVSK